MGSPLLIQGSGPVSIVAPAAAQVKQGVKLFTYADMVSMASGANPWTIAPAEPGKLLQPMYLNQYMDRTNTTAGTASSIQIRWPGVATNLMAFNSTTPWNNGPGATLFQMIILLPVNAAIFTGTGGVDYRNTALQLVNTSATLATGCVGTVKFVLTYLSIPI